MVKIAARDVSAFVKKPDHFKTILIFGPDEGLIRDYSKSLVNAVAENPDDPFATTQLEASDIKDEPSKLYEALSAMSLMGDNPIILVRNATDKITKIIKQAGELPECQNQLIVMAGELPARSSLRKLCEQEKNIAVIACYREEGYALERIIKEKFDAASIKYSRDVIDIIKQSLGNDRGVTTSEIDKIITYMGDETQLTIDIVSELINQNDDKGFDDLCTAVADGNSAKVNHLIERLSSEGVNPIAILRSVGRYFTRLSAAQEFASKGKSPADAMKMVKPPVFYKQQQSFGRHMGRCRTSTIDKILSTMTKAETELKRSSEQILICSRYLTVMAHQCRK